jgi:hypothetical protein
MELGGKLVDSTEPALSEVEWAHHRSADGGMAMLLKSVMSIAVCVVRKTKNTQYAVRKTHNENE